MDNQSIENTQSLGDVLNTIETFPWNYVLYLRENGPWDEQADCAVLDPNDTEGDDLDEVPERAKHLGLKNALGVSETQEVVENAKLQRPNVDIMHLVKAFNYYFANDAFIDL